MMVIFVSECEKRALKKTRRVLDAFASRIGTNTWQTVITQEGLLTVKKMLRKTASKSTAVSCHWLRSRARSDFLWVVGNKNKFNYEGIVAVNRTEQEDNIEESFAVNTEIIANLAAIAGFFHDIGKANQLFQNKLEVERTGLGYEPLRHEWVSLRLFQAFVDKKDDRQWLNDLVDITNAAERDVLDTLKKYKDLLIKSIPCPLTSLPPIAKTVAWLIVSHHRLPQYPRNLSNPPSLDSMDKWRQIFEPCWNAPQSASNEWTQQDKEQNWTFPYGTLFKSAFWQTHLSSFAKKALACQQLFTSDWHDNLFTTHVSRLVLMLADHAVSSQEKSDNTFTDRNYLAYANTDKDTHGQKYKKQKLDEHNILVGKMACDIAFDIPRLKYKLNHLDQVKALEKKVSKDDRDEFGWQDKAVDLALKIRDKTNRHGFFGISMASTGKGKTRVNAKIMYALSEKGRCRFNVALGLRTLSIQTADALKKDLDLSDGDIALLIGSQAVRDLQQVFSRQEKNAEEDRGSQSKESLLKDEINLVDSLDLDTLEQIAWIKHDPKILKLLHAPVLVSTIDYLMPATEGVRGGRQIAPMLRLLTSDLVLDEPDDFSLDDLPALCRLVNWAGMLGSKVLLSTATISPSFASALFEAYQAGRTHYTQANNEQGEEDKVCCAWFDECNTPEDAIVQRVDQFEKIHNDFVNKRVDKIIKKTKTLRKGKLVEVDSASSTLPSVAFADRIYQSITELHNVHAIELNEKRVSIGLVRMANIDPLVHISKQLFARAAPDNTLIHYCVYHGQFPLLQRSSIEKQLDKALKRHNKQEWEKKSGIAQVVAREKAKHHIFVVLATSVAEVGRDHDYDWAIVEPSSTRSMIQLAGRVQRHRQQTPNQENIHILAQNFKGLKGKLPCFEKPGFETARLQYASSDLQDLHLESEINDITAIPRVLAPKPSEFNLTEDYPRKFKKFSQLEHVAQMLRLRGSETISDHAAQWWQQDVTWCAEMQRIQPFRKSRSNQDYCLSMTREEKPMWQKKQQDVYPVKYENTDDICIPSKPVNLGIGIQFWHPFDLQAAVNELSQVLDISQQNILQVYTHVTLDELNEDTHEQWQYQPQLGVYKILKGDEYKHDQ